MIPQSRSRSTVKPDAEAAAYEAAKTELIAQARGAKFRAQLRGGQYSNKVLLEKSNGNMKLGKAPSRFNVFARRRHERRAERYAQSLTTIVESLFARGNPGVQRAADKMLDFILAQQGTSGRTQFKDSKELLDALKELKNALKGSAPSVNGPDGSELGGRGGFAERMADVAPTVAAVGTPADNSSRPMPPAEATAFARRMNDHG